MAVHLTKIYTRTGDDGTTGLADFSRVHKTDPRLVAYADADEANAALGVALAMGGLADDIAEVLRQRAERPVRRRRRPAPPRSSRTRRCPRCASPRPTSTGWRAGATGTCEGLPKLDSFILPGGTPGAALLHVARTVTRRAERSAWALLDVDPEHANVLTAKYLNRLSDLLFILCRRANPDGDVKWRPGGNA